MGLRKQNSGNAKGKEVAKGAARQCTLKRPINCTGIALHSGLKVSMTLKPAPADSGIVFKRTDIAGKGADIPARWDHVVDTRMCTVLGNDEGVTVGTIEHLMSALAGCRIDNAEIEINGPEVPVMDGSASPFVFLIECAGIREQDAPRRAIRILKSITVEDGDRRVTIEPGDGFALKFEIDFSNTAVSQQTLDVALGSGTFKKELARARTFGFLHEVEALWAMGLAKGGSLDNAVVVSGDKILNEDGLRYDDEFVRHKLLDAVGDLYLAGAPIMGLFTGHCSGHAHTNQLLRKLLADADAWCWEDAAEGETEAPGAGTWIGNAADAVALSA